MDLLQVYKELTFCRHTQSGLFAGVQRVDFVQGCKEWTFCRCTKSGLFVGFFSTADTDCKDFFSWGGGLFCFLFKCTKSGPCASFSSACQRLVQEADVFTGNTHAQEITITFFNLLHCSTKNFLSDVYKIKLQKMSKFCA